MGRTGCFGMSGLLGSFSLFSFCQNHGFSRMMGFRGFGAALGGWEGSTPSVDCISD
nr:hypothetical protein [Saprospiraceae bacterium]